MIVSNRKIMLVSMLSLAAMILVLFLMSLESQAAEIPINGAPSGDIATGRSCPLSEPTIRTVTSTADSGPGTLRQCLLEAQAGTIITFDHHVFPPPPFGPAIITLTSGRLEISQGNITIDGSLAGIINDSSVARVIIDGSQLSSEYADGFCITSTNNTIKGLTIQNFPSDGVDIRDGANRIENCVIRGNGKRGVRVAGYKATGNKITRNRITGNTEMGILLHDYGNAWITRPLIHTVVTSTGWITVTGWARPTAVVEVFADPGGEGATFLGQTMADVMGVFTLSVANNVPDGDNITATATDADGNTSEFGCYPLPQPTLRWPLSCTFTPGGEFSSPYGPRLKASEGFRYDWHRGLDITATVGSPVYAVADGVVRWAEKQSSTGGLMVQIEHEEGAYFSTYIHLTQTNVITGQPVGQCDVIGYSGTSDSGFPHLHFEIRECGFYQRHTVNPFLYLPYNDTVRHTAVFSTVETAPAVGDSVLVMAPVVVTAPRDELDFNAITLEVRGDDSSLLDRRSIDFHALNARTLYPMPTPDPLDNPCNSNVCISPTRFSTRSDEYRIEFLFIGMQGHCPMTLTASAADVHQNVAHATYPLTDCTPNADYGANNAEGASTVGSPVTTPVNWYVYLPIITKNPPSSR